MNTNAIQKSIVLNGAAGSGKSLLARELSKTLGYPVISTDTFRHLPSQKYWNDFDLLPQERKKLELEKLRNAFFNGSTPLHIVENELKKMRESLPNVRNYEQMGFDPNVSQIIDRQFGKVAWHFYQKQFETALFEEIVENITTPVVLDLGGGMGISLDKDYKKLEEMARNVDEKKFKAIFPMRAEIGFDKIKSLLDNFPNVVYLELPNDFFHLQKASKDPLNKIFLSTHQYEETATQTVKAEMLFDENGKVNWTGVFDCVNLILSKCKNITPLPQEKLQYDLDLIDAELKSQKENNTIKDTPTTNNGIGK